jgi:tetratricopeptide (TPR) repeat protein
VLSHDIFLGPDEIQSLRVVPELVFLNCCHLARRASDLVLGTATQPQPEFDRAGFAASIADALINVGVRCVIAAGWAVEDEPARMFATTFYSALMGGTRFIDAVAEAREAALGQGGNTWAAYQCYGDPDWRFRRQGGDPQRPSTSPGEEFAGVASPSALKLALHTLAVRSAHQGADAKRQRARIRFLEKRFGERWGSMGAVAEAFGVACSEVGDRRNAIDWYERARAAADGAATLKAAEQLANLRVRLAWENMDRALSARERTAGTARDAAQKGLQGAAQTARSDIEKSCELLEKLLAIHSTAERENLLGSAYKRLAMVEAAIGNEKHANDAVLQMVQHYENAEAVSAGESDSDVFYPAMNCLAAKVALNAKREEIRRLRRRHV